MQPGRSGGRASVPERGLLAVGIHDRDYHGPGSGDGRGSLLRRVFGDGENPLTWALPLYTAFGIRVRIHLMFVLVIAIRLLSSISQDQFGLAYMAVAMGALFVLVLLHEYGHCFACRAVRGEADEILMWPLGGLASCRPPHGWAAHLWTVVGGPAVNLAIFPLTTLGLVALTGGGWQWAWLNPLDLSWVAWLGGGFAGVALGLVHYTNLLLLLFNVLVPMYPMDGGRMLQAVLWRRMGYGRSMRLTATVGLVAAFVLVAVALAGLDGANSTTLFAIALLGGVVCWMERKKLEFESGLDSGFGRGEPDAVYASYTAAVEPDQPSPRELRRQQQHEDQLAAEQAEIDRLLQKIHTHGLESLTRRERKTLDQASKRQRRQSEERPSSPAR